MASRFASAPVPSFGERRSGGHSIPPPANVSPLIRQTGFFIPPSPATEDGSVASSTTPTPSYIDPSMTTLVSPASSAPSGVTFGGVAMPEMDETLVGLLDDQAMARLHGVKHEASLATGWTSATDATIPRYFNPNTLVHRHYSEPSHSFSSPSGSLGTGSYPPSETSYGGSSIATPVEDSQAMFAAPTISRSGSGSRLGQLTLNSSGGSGGSGKALPLSRSAYGHARRMSSGTNLSSLSQSPSGLSPFNPQIKSEPVPLTVPASPNDAWTAPPPSTTPSYPYSMPTSAYQQRTPLASQQYQSSSPYAWTPPGTQSPMPARRSSANATIVSTGFLPSSTPATSASFSSPPSLSTSFSGGRGKLPGVSEQPESKTIVSEKRKKRRESHNLVERRRRDTINGCITELGELLPPSMLEPSAASHHHAPASTIIRERERAANGGLSGDVYVGGSSGDPSSPPVLMASPSQAGPVLRPNKGAILKGTVLLVKYQSQLLDIRAARILALEAIIRENGLTQQLLNLDSSQSTLTESAFQNDYIAVVRSRHASDEDAEGEYDDDRMEN